MQEVRSGLVTAMMGPRMWPQRCQVNKKPNLWNVMRPCEVGAAKEGYLAIYETATRSIARRDSRLRKGDRDGLESGASARGAL